MKNELPEINQFNLSFGLLTKYKSLIHTNAMWHKVEVENANKIDRNTLLRTLMNVVYPLDFIPVCYEVKGPVVSFLLKNCGVAIERLCRHNLIVANPQDPSTPFKIKVLLNFAYAADLRINIQSNITKILAKRFNIETGVLNLEMFHKDPDLIEFCTLSQPRLMLYVLHLSHTDNRANHVKSLKLSSNEIEVLKPLEALSALKTFTALDLRNNNIKEIDPSNFKDLPITELWLDGNPICDDYDEFTYPKAMKDMIPTLERLDGINVQNKGMWPFRKNFLCSTAGHDLVDQFLEHYFNLYDSPSRALLEGMYHKEAMFSLSVNYIALQTTSLHAVLTPYKKVARNLKMMSDFSKNGEYLFRGPQAIVQLLTSLPATEHDPYTFTVDLMSYTDMTAVLVVTGVFREAPENLLDLDRLLGFSRIFVLLAGQSNEYSIVNEQLHVHNATSAQVLRAFKQSKTTRQVNIEIPSPQNTKEQVMLAETLVSFTGLTVDWATKCLEECQYDLKRSLELFVGLFKLDKIPSDAFRSTPSAEEPQFKNPAALFEELFSKPPPSISSYPKAAIIQAQNYVHPVGHNYIPLGTEHHNSKVLQFTSPPPKPVMRKDNCKRQDNQNLHQIRASAINEDDDCIIIDSQPTQPEQLLHRANMAATTTLPLCGVVENYEPFMYPKVVDRVPQSKQISKVELSDLWPIVSRLEGFNKKFADLKKKCLGHHTGYLQSMELAMDIVRCYSYHVAAYQVLMLWYFPRHKPAAREFCKQASKYMAANQARSISFRLFDTLRSECECARGNPAVGTKRLKELIVSFPRKLDAVKALLRYIGSQPEAANDARDFITWAMQVPNIDKEGVKEIVTQFEIAFKIEVLKNLNI